MAQRVKDIESNEEIIDEKKILKEAEEREKEIKKEIKEAKEEEKKQTKELKSKGTEEQKRKKPRHGKKYRNILKAIEKGRDYELSEALALVKKTSITKFDSSIEMHIKIDKKMENIRGVVALPGGLAKERKVLEITNTNVDDVLKEIKDGKADFDIIIAHPEIMPKLASLAKILGPKGLMPNPKSGTVTENTKEVAEEFKKKKIEFKADKGNVVHALIGRVSFDDMKLKENFEAILSALPKGKIQSIYLSSSMGPSVKVQI